MSRAFFLVQPYFALLPFIHYRYWIRLGLQPRRGGAPPWIKVCAECMLSVAFTSGNAGCSIFTLSRPYANPLCQELLDRADFARERASSGGQGVGGAGAGGGVGGGRGMGVQTSLAPSAAGSRVEGSDELSDEGWAQRSREAWSTVMYQVRDRLKKI